MTQPCPIAQRRAAILESLAAAKTSVQLIAVSKTQPDSLVKAAIKAGQTVFGENRVQEAQNRWGETFKDKRGGLELHLIGPLQSNKALDAARLFDVIQTVDRPKLVKALAAANERLGKLPKLWVQVNTGEEPQKAGILPQDLHAFLDLMRQSGLKPEGLMCIPPVSEAPSPHFILLSHMAKTHGLNTVSMGMSADFETAAALGATHVRVGSALFGDRPKP